MAQIPTNPKSQLNPVQIWGRFFLYYLAVVFIFMLIPTIFLQVVSLNGVWSFLIGLSRFFLTTIALLIVARLQYKILKTRYPKQDIEKFAVASWGLFLAGLFLTILFPWEIFLGNGSSESGYNYNFEAISNADRIETKSCPFVGDNASLKTTNDPKIIQQIIQMVKANSSSWNRSFSEKSPTSSCFAVLDFYKGKQMVGEIGLAPSEFTAESYFSKEIGSDQIELLLRLLKLRESPPLNLK